MNNVTYEFVQQETPALKGHRWSNIHGTRWYQVLQDISDQPLEDDLRRQNCILFELTQISDQSDAEAHQLQHLSDAIAKSPVSQYSRLKKIDRQQTA